MQDDSPRLIALEEKLLYLEKHIGDLDEVVRDLADRLDHQAGSVRQVRKMLEQHLAGGGDDKSGPASEPDPEADRPPHW